MEGEREEEQPYCETKLESPRHDAQETSETQKGQSVAVFEKLTTSITKRTERV